MTRTCLPRHPQSPPPWRTHCLLLCVCRRCPCRPEERPAELPPPRHPIGCRRLPALRHNRGQQLAQPPVEGQDPPRHAPPLTLGCRLDLHLQHPLPGPRPSQRSWRERVSRLCRQRPLSTQSDPGAPAGCKTTAKTDRGPHARFVSPSRWMRIRQRRPSLSDTHPPVFCAPRCAGSPVRGSRRLPP